MKKLTHILLASGALFAATFTSHAQTPPNVAVVDIEKVFNQHYSFIAEQAKLKQQLAQAQTDLNGLAKQRQQMIDEYKALQDQSSNPAMSADAQTKNKSDMQTKAQEINAKTQEMQKFSNDARNATQQQFVSFRASLVEDISQVATRIGKAHNANLILAKTAPLVIYADPSYDITDEVIADINKNKPAEATPAPAVTPETTAPSAAPSAEGAPNFSVPNVTPGK